MKMVLKRIVFVLAVVLLAASGAAHAAGDGLLQAGSVATGPAGIFPSWFMDKKGLALEACVDGTANCLGATLATLTDPANPLFEGEAFYWWANADLVHPNGANGFVEIALEAVLVDPLAAVLLSVDNTMVFNRLRVRLDALPSGGRYTIAHPFGQTVLIATRNNKGIFEINNTVDLPGSSGLASFSGVLNAPNLGPFLEQKTGAPAGYIGSTDVARPIKGGTVRDTLIVTGPNGFRMSTGRFLVLGKIATNGGLSGVRATYSRTAAGAKTVTVSASSIGRQNILAQLGGPTPRNLRLRAVTGQRGRYTAKDSYPGAFEISPCVVTNMTDASRPSVTISTVPDLVTVSRASWSNGVLTVRATTSDLLVPRPVLELVDPVSGTVVARRRGVLNATIRTGFKPARITVRSGAGGTATAVVR